LRAAIIDRYRRVARQHPDLAVEAAAFADTVIVPLRAGRCGIRRASKS
jgi:hypothetical protein